MHAEGLTHAGLVREKNEDCFRIKEKLGLVVVADGMGGHSSGEVASSLAADTVVTEIDKLLPQNKKAQEVLREAFMKANSTVYKCAEDDNSNAGMGTTLTAALLLDKLYVAHVGDSRLYLWRDGKLSLLTEDHSYVAELVRNGSITADEAKNHPRRNVLLNALGIEPTLNVDILTADIKPQDTYILCTDGFHSLLQQEELEQILEEFNSFDELLKHVLQSTLAQGAPDNITVVLARP